MEKLTKILLIALLLGSTIFNIKGCIENKKLEKSLASLKMDSLKISNAVKTEARIIARQVDKFGSEHVTISATENVYPVSILRQPAVSTGLLDTVAMALKIKTKQVEELTRINSTLNVKNARAYYSLDSLKRRTIQYNDKYVSIAFTPDTTEQYRD